MKIKLADGQALEHQGEGKLKDILLEKDKSLQEIVQLGFDEKLVTRVIRSVDLNEYKRRQSPPGVKITPRAFGRDRRLPITNRCREY